MSVFIKDPAGNSEGSREYRPTDISFDKINHFGLHFDSLSFPLVASGGLGFVTSMEGGTRAA